MVVHFGKSKLVNEKGENKSRRVNLEMNIYTMLFTIYCIQHYIIIILIQPMLYTINCKQHCPNIMQLDFISMFLDGFQEGVSVRGANFSVHLLGSFGCNTMA